MNPSPGNPAFRASPWQTLHQSAQAGPLWYWLPGWSFQAEIFLPLMQQLPGRHLGYRWPTQNLSFDQAVDCLRACSEPGALWVGWSLGGALAYAAAPHCQASALVTLATGQRFLQSPEAGSDQAGPGMAVAEFEAFCQAMAESPERTLKRFIGLCASGSAQRKPLMQTLAQYQMVQRQQAHASLMTGLDWLAQYRLDQNHDLPDNTGLTQQHIYGDRDALNPGGLQPSQHIPESGHAFWLEDSGRAALLALLGTLAEVCDGD